MPEVAGAGQRIPKRRNRDQRFWARLVDERHEIGPELRAPPICEQIPQLRQMLLYQRRIPRLRGSVADLNMRRRFSLLKMSLVYESWFDEYWPMRISSAGGGDAAGSARSRRRPRSCVMAYWIPTHRFSRSRLRLTRWARKVRTVLSPKDGASERLKSCRADPAERLHARPQPRATCESGVE